jgi:hypothetical protein
MTPERFFRLSVALPLAIPALAVTGSLALRTIGSPGGDALGAASAVLLASVIIGGLPYLVVALPLLRSLRGRSVGAYRRLSIVAPILYAAVLTFCLTVYFYVEGTSAGVRGSFETALGFAAYAIAFGYFYVLLTHLLYALLGYLGRMGTYAA